MAWYSIHLDFFFVTNMELQIYSIEKYMECPSYCHLTITKITYCQELDRLAVIGYLIVRVDINVLKYDCRCPLVLCLVLLQ